MAESIQRKLSRVRPPRVQIEYEVYIGDSIRMKELPFVVGILADLSGKKPEEALPPIKDRTFTEVNRDNFNAFLKSVEPHLEFTVADKITNDPNNKISVKLDFQNIDDFTPGKLVDKVDELKQLLEKREKLSRLLAKLDGNTQVSKQLWEIIANTEARQKTHEDADRASGASGGV